MLPEPQQSWLGPPHGSQTPGSPLVRALQARFVEQLNPALPWQHDWPLPPQESLEHESEETKATASTALIGALRWQWVLRIGFP